MARKKKSGIFGLGLLPMGGVSPARSANRLPHQVESNITGQNYRTIRGVANEARNVARINGYSDAVRFIDNILEQLPSEWHRAVEAAAYRRIDGGA